MKHIETKIQQACDRIAPLWPLKNFVAVNPFLGFSEASFDDTALYFKQVQNAELTLSLNDYREAYRKGEIGQEDLQAALREASDKVRKAFEEAQAPLTAKHLLESTPSEEDGLDELYRPGAFSAYVDSRLGTHWQFPIREEAAKWCAAYYDGGQSGWPFPWKADDFYSAWHEACAYDRNLACAGLSDARDTLADLPANPRATIDLAIEEMKVPEDIVEEWLYRVLLILPGWAGHTRYLDREDSLRGQTGSASESLLAMLLAYELVLFRHYAHDEDCLLGWRRLLVEEPVKLGGSDLPLDLATRLLWQSAYEHSIEQGLHATLNHRPKDTATETRPEIEAAFCIDVRSEPFRNQLEAVSPQLKTKGYAGFFGVPLQHQHCADDDLQARCPALLAPFIDSREITEMHLDIDGQRQAARGLKRFKEASASCFSFVETLGLSYGLQLLRDAFGFRSGSGPLAVKPATHIDSAKRLQLATGIVRGLGLQKDCARLVLLCGHGSETRNNPYASGLDCGACGGHAGDLNARIAAAILNDPLTRRGLKDQGLGLPDDACFIAGKHNTTTDEVSLFDTEDLPTSHRKLLEALQGALSRAGLYNARQRSLSLGCDRSSASREVSKRSRDWSQTRPEWGLAGNAGFIVAPRSWTQTADLEGRAFLHEYEPALDPDGSLLESILAGPMVVGSWINLQYYASAADNKHFGSGHKAIHNVVGGLGVSLGNESDLRPGLPMQSVHNGSELVHKPSRLHVCVATDPAILDRILAKHPNVEALVRNQWIHLFAIGRDGRQWRQCVGLKDWRLHQGSPKSS